ncbi:MAG: hypothetical protein H8E03_01180 [Pelagibacteraceae bacterium]|nr:hypothetical protein [Pelagibacteraceae bacterium]
MSAKTTAGKALEKYLQKKIEDTLTIATKIKIGEYEGTLTTEELKKLKLKLDEREKKVRDTQDTIDGFKLQAKGMDLTISTQEIAAVGNPTGGISAAALILREKAKIAADDLNDVIDEQADSAINSIKKSLRDSKRTINLALKSTSKNKKRLTD